MRRSAYRRARQSAGKTPTQSRLIAKIPQTTGDYLAGFVDGEGSFNVSFRPRRDYRQPWKVSLCFNISQRENTLLVLFRELVEAGTTRRRADGCWYYEANSLRAIRSSVIPFFERFGFLSLKRRRDFAKFRELAQMMSEGRHLSYGGVVEILRIRRDMNDGGKRRYSDAEILRRYGKENPQRLHARPAKAVMRQSELHGDVQSG